MPQTPPIHEPETPALRARLDALVAEFRENLLTGARETTALQAAALDAVCAEPTLSEAVRASPLSIDEPGARNRILQRAFEHLLRHPLEDPPRLVAHLERALVALAALEPGSTEQTSPQWLQRAQRIVGTSQILRRHASTQARQAPDAGTDAGTDAARATLSAVDEVRALLEPRLEASREAAQAAALAQMSRSLREHLGRDGTEEN